MNVTIVGLGAPGLVNCPESSLTLIRGREVRAYEVGEATLLALEGIGASVVPDSDFVVVEGHPMQHRGLLESLAESTLTLVPGPAHVFGHETFVGLEGVVRLVDRLLGPGGCPWDQAQTHESLKPHLIEESYELLDAIDLGDRDKLCEELGDVLLQPVLHAQIAAKNGGFDTRDVADALIAKLVRRHPHVFGDVDANDAETVLRNWDRIKKSEGGEEKSILAGVPRSLPALLRALQVSKRAARVGFEWPNLESVLEKVDEERAELAEAIGSGEQGRIAAELGDLLFTLVNVARWCKVDPEDALRAMLDRFTRRFQHMESLAGRPLAELGPQEWDDLWNASKSAVG